MSVTIPPIGTLRDRVQILTKDMAAEPGGGHAVTYMAIATVWARVHVRMGTRTDQANARAARATHSVVMRYRTDVSPGDRVMYRGSPLEVISANDLNGRKAYLDCACIAVNVTG